MSRMHPKCPGSELTDHSITADVHLREEPDDEEEEEEDEDEGGGEEEENDGESDDGYSE